MRIVSFITSLIAALVSGALSGEPRFVYLTWQGDTGSTMTVNFQTFDRAGESVVLYDTISRSGNPEGYRHRAEGASHQVKGIEGRFIHVVEFIGLTPGGQYFFIAGDSAGGFSREYRFRTIPEDDSPLRFVTGGDLGTSENVPRLLRQAALQEPQFALLGGDLAYANGQLDNYDRWDQWLEYWTQEMVTPSGLTIPMVLAIGNHETNDSDSGVTVKAPFYFGYFGQSGNTSFFRREFGSLAVFYMLDSGHITPHAEQVPKIKDWMSSDQDIPYRFAVYHIPLYPSHRRYMIYDAIAGRQYWAPLFDQFRLTAAFENHDHTFKRTHLIFGDKVAEQGTLYLGDGALGQGPRPFDLHPRWYLSKFASHLHFWRVDLDREGVEYKAVDIEGEVFDVYPPDADGAEEAKRYFSENVFAEYEEDEHTYSFSPLLVEEDLFEEKVLRAEVKNHSPVKMRTRLEFETEAPFEAVRKRMRARLRGGESRNYELLLSTPKAVAVEKLSPLSVSHSSMYSLPDKKVQIEGVKLLRVEKVNVISWADRPVGVDGRLEEWPLLPYSAPVPGWKPVVSNNVDWTGEMDASFRFGVLRDEAFLYLAIEATDDRREFVPGVAAWKNEGLLLWANTFPEGDWDDDPLFAVSPGVTAEATYYTAVSEPPDDVKAVSLLTETGYLTEIAIPLSWFEQVWIEEGGEGPLETIRLNIAMSDRDEADGKPMLLYWRPEWDSAADYYWSGVFKLVETDVATFEDP